MTSVSVATILFGCLSGVVLLGRAVRRHLPHHHLSADSKDAVKLAMDLVATMTALLLGLLVSSAKGSYDTERSEVIQMAAKVMFLDRGLALYGPEAADARAHLRDAITKAVQSMWPEKGTKPAAMSLNEHAGDAVYVAIQQLTPHDETQRAIKVQASSLAVELGQLRTLLLAQSVPSISKPLLIALVCWLVVLFLSFSLLAPPNATTALALVAAAFSVAGAIFLILELDQPFGGLIRISSAPLHSVLEHIAK